MSSADLSTDSDLLGIFDREVELDEVVAGLLKELEELGEAVRGLESFGDAEAASKLSDYLGDTFVQALSQAGMHFT